MLPGPLKDQSKTVTTEPASDSPRSSVWSRIRNRFARQPAPTPSTINTKSNNPWIAGLCSFAIHVALLLGLAIWTVSGFKGNGGISLKDQSGEPSVVDSVETLEMDSGKSDGEESIASIDMTSISPAILESNAQPSMELETPSTVAIESPTASLVQNAGVGKVGGAFVVASTEGRKKQNRGTVGTRNGATPASEAAVEAALAYLARHQRNNGSWSTRFDFPPCQDECDHGGVEKDPHEIAATGLALLCFLGAGNTMQDGEYQEQVNRGVYFLIQNLKIRYGRGQWLTEVAAAEMYEHGIATLALCEALQMTGDASIKEYCQAAINHIIYSQHPDGGWDYHPQGPGDLSIVGWQVMALKSAYGANLEVPPDTIRSIDVFLKRHVRKEFMFVYRNGLNPTDSMTAIGTLMKLFRGASKTDPTIIKAMEYLANVGPSNKDVYYNYYASQALFHFGGKPWTVWNPQLREFLIRTQEQNGHMAGSWFFSGDMSNEQAGRLYVTAMACLSLEVYYRYMPVYETTQDEFKF